MPTYQDVKKREEQVLKMIDDGLLVADMARELGITPQSVHKFLKVRGWVPKNKGGSGSYRKDKKNADPAHQERIKKRKQMNSSVDRSGTKKA